MAGSIFSNINPSTTSGNQLATILNDFKDAVRSGFSGTARPTNLAAGGYWIDTSNDPNTWSYKLFDGVNDVTIFIINLATGTASFSSIDGQLLLTKRSADAIGPILEFLKKRIANNGQTLIGDSLGDINFKATDNGGNPLLAGRVRVVTSNDTVAGQYGSYMVWELVNLNTASLTEKMRLVDGNLGVGTTTPSSRLHIRNGSGLTIENVADTNLGGRVTTRKKRIAGNGQVLANDFIFVLDSNSTDETGTEITKAFSIEVSASENHTSTNQGTKVELKTKDTGTAAATTKILIQDVVTFPIGLRSKDLIVGSNGTLGDNVKVMRSAANKLSFVKGNDVTAEGTNPTTTLSEIAFRAEEYTSGTKPASSSGNKGRIIYVSDTNRLEFDTGTAWKAIGSGGGGSGSNLGWMSGEVGPYLEQSGPLGPEYQFDQTNSGQTAICSIDIPEDYFSEPIKINLAYYISAATNLYKVGIKAVLIKNNVDVNDETYFVDLSFEKDAATYGSSKLQRESVTISSDGTLSGQTIAGKDIIKLYVTRPQASGTEADATLNIIKDKTGVIYG